MKVLLVEDSRTVRAYVEGVLRTAPDLVVLPTATDGLAALEAVLRDSPDVVLLDLELPKLDGLDVLREIMDRAPRPVIVLSAHVHGPSERAFASLHAGAVEVLAKPQGLSVGDVADFGVRLIRTVRLMSRARVIRRRLRRDHELAESAQHAHAQPLSQRSYGRVLIGASTGGPSLVHEILASVRKPYPLPILLAQHVLAGFDVGLAQWLSTTGHRVALALGGERPEAGRVYLAPADENLALRGDAFVRVPPANRPSQALPSVDVLFDSVAHACGPSTLAVLLTGMGSDGAKGMLALRKAGAATVAQEGASCVVNGMPEAARGLGAVEQTLSPAQIIDLLEQVAQRTLRAERLASFGIA